MMALIVSLSVFAVGCKKESLSDPNAGRQLRYKTYQGLHDFTAPDFEGEDYLVKNGKTDYVLVFPEASDQYERTAKAEFVLLFKKATGISISTKSDADTLPEGAKFISIGKTVQYNALEVTEDELQTLTNDGCRIITKDKNIYIYGGNTGYWARNRGVMYAVYTFMEIYFNFDQVHRNCTVLDTGINEVKLKDFNVWDVPDIKGGRQTHGGDTADTHNSLRWYEADAGITSQDISNRTIRTRQSDDAKGMSSFTTFGDYSSASAHMHNTSELVSPKSEGTNPKWFSDAGDQLCYTAHGDPQAYQDLVVYICKKFVMTMKYFNPTDYPTRCYLGIMQEDNTAFCNCQSCVDFNAANNDSVAAGMVKLCNDTITLIRAWQDDPTHEVYPYRRDNLKVVFFAYNASNVPTATWSEEDQRYYATSPECDPNEYVVPWICPRWSYINDIYNPTSDRRRKEVDGWSDIVDETWFWFYSGDWKYDPYFKEAYNIHNNHAYQFMAAMNCTHTFDNISAAGSDPTAFRALLLYLWYKLSWNSNLDAQELTQKYFDSMFGAVSDDMQEILYLYIDHANLLALHPSWGGSYNRAMFWSYNGFLKPVADKYEAILAKVDAVYGATDPAYGELIKSRVCQEYYITLYKIIQLYGLNSANAPFVESVRQEYKERYRYMVERYFPGNDTNGYGGALEFIEGVA